MRPSRTQLYWVAGWVFLALVLAMVRHEALLDNAGLFTFLWWCIGSVLAILVVVDYARHRTSRRIQANRHMPGSFSLGSANTVTLRIDNPFGRPLRLVVFDQYPKQIKVEEFPISLTIPAKKSTEIRYHAQPIERGDAEFGLIELSVLSRWKLWDYYYRCGKPSRVKVYPNFANIGSLSMLDHEQQASQLGIHVQQRRGQGLEFHQLREYRKGDSLSQIDWKATARYVKLISRDYQDERDQDIIFLLDCGRRMRTFDGELSHFDHALNALLFMSYIALKRGDAVGLLTFAGDSRWINPIKGPTAINKLLNHVYNLHSTTNTSDLLQAAETLMAHHRKRALIILISNIHQEDRDDIVAATQVLAKHHLVMVASLRENYLDKVLMDPIIGFKSALSYSGAHYFLEQRKRVLEALVDRGIVITDSLAQSLHIDLANMYLKLKRSGRI